MSRDSASAPARPIADADHRQHQSLAHDHAPYLVGLRAERHADADLARAEADHVADHAVDADRA